MVSRADIPQSTIIAVIAADKEQTYALSETVAQIRERFQIRKEQLPIARIPSQKLTPQDYKRVGFTPQSLPVIARMKVSSSQNLEGVLGSPPYIFRNVKQATLPAQVLLCRWMEMTHRPLPEELRNIATIYEPHRIFVLNTAETPSQVEEAAREIEKVKAANGVTQRELPVLSTTYHDGLLGEEEYTRLGFVSDAFPIVCLVQMSEAANPSRIVGEGILRWSYNTTWSARQIVRLWARLQRRSLPGLPDDGDRFSLVSSTWASGNSQLPAGRPAPYQCSLTNYRYGVGGRFWLQVSGRIVNTQGVEVSSVPVQDFKQEAASGPVQTTYRVQSEITTPSNPGHYILELEFRDKVGAARTSCSLPFDI
jgi:hypothetical protein